MLVSGYVKSSLLSQKFSFFSFIFSFIQASVCRPEIKTIEQWLYEPKGLPVLFFLELLRGCVLCSDSQHWTIWETRAKTQQQKTHKKPFNQYWNQHPRTGQAAPTFLHANEHFLIINHADWYMQMLHDLSNVPPATILIINETVNNVNPFFFSFRKL